MFKKLTHVVSKYENIEAQLSSPEVISNQSLFQALSKEHSDLQALVSTYKEYSRTEKLIADNDELIQLGDEELKEIAMVENRELKLQLGEIEKKLRVLLLPKDPNDSKNILMEVRAGAGGDEAGIFAADLFRVYNKYAETMGWRVEVMSLSHNSAGGFKEAIAMIRGENVYSKLKYESGVHRVQRVPKTETQGRVHTSTVTIAVLPEADDVEVKIDPSDLRIDVFRSSGPGGQSVNTTDSAVRLTHIPTGVVVICQDEKSQHKNKAKAMKVLQTRLYDQKLQVQQDEISQDRRTQLGTGERSEKIRTYNYPQGRITDHRIGHTIHSLDSYMEGDIDSMLGHVAAYYEAELLQRQSQEGEA